MTEDDAKKVLQGHGLCGFISNGDQISDGDDCTRQACILPRHHDDGLHDPPVMMTIPSRLVHDAQAALQSFISGPLSDCFDGGSPLTGYRLEEWNRVVNVAGQLLAQLQK